MDDARRIRLVEIRRVSTEEQAHDDRSGLDRQADSNRRTAERVGATLIEPPVIITDVCRENFIDTPEWRTIHALIVEPDVHLVVDQQDRVIGALEGIPILIACKKTKTLIYHSQGVTDPTTFAGQVLATFTALAAGNELDSIKYRAQGSKESRRKEGIFPSSEISLPTGVAYVRTKGRKAGRWTYNEKISVVREIYRLVVDEGRRNWREVARLSGACSGVTVRNILENPIYKGWWIVDERRQPGPTPIKSDGRRKDRKKIKRDPSEIHRHQVFRPRHSPATADDSREESIVDESTWDLVQTIVENKRRDFHRPREPKGDTRFVYTGRIWCATCGSQMWSKTRPKSQRHPSRRDWYACASTQRHAGSCPTKYIRRHTVNDALDQLFSRVFADARFLDALVEQGLDSEREDFTARIATTSKALRKLEDQRTRLLDLYMEGSWERGELDARRAKLDKDRDTVDRELKRLQRAQAANDKATVLDGLREVLLALQEFKFWTPQQKRALLAKFFPRIEISKRGVERVQVTLPGVRIVDGREVSTERDLPISTTVEMPWAELVAPPALNDLGLVPKALYKRADIKQALGLTEAQFVGRLAAGAIPAPTTKHRGHRAWTEAEVRTMVAAARDAEEPGEFGLPPKTLYSTGDLCQVLGIPWDRLRRMITRGEVPDSARRDANGHRVWSAEEMRAAIEAHGARAGESSESSDDAR